jgi:carboxyl-terminal processing protease
MAAEDRFRIARPISRCSVLRFSVPLYLCLICFGLGTLIAQSSTRPNLSPVASTYLNHVLDLMQQNVINAKEIDWTTVRREAFLSADGAKTTVDTYPAIYYALTQLKEHHSSLQLSDSLSAADKHRTLLAKTRILDAYKNSFPKPPPSPYRERSKPSGQILRLSSSFTAALIVIPHLYNKYSNWDDNATDFQEYANALHRLAADLQSQRPQGWIVDLRGNEGGNMWPMLAGIGFVLGEGRAGAFISSDGSHSFWSYREGKAIEADKDGAETVDSAVTQAPLILSPLPPVAVLIDGGTASSGESMAISFAGRSNEKSFGTHSYGLSSANDAYPLSDGSTLFLNTAIDADRLDRKYPDGIQPDVLVPASSDASPVDSDPVVKAAEEWLLSRNR